LLFLQGCGGSPARGTLSGKVTFNDKPLTAGTVIFSKQDSSETEVTPIQPDGTYKSENVPLGDLRIGVLAPTGGAAMPGGGKLPPRVPADHPQAKMYAQSASGQGVNLPKHLSDPATSKITVKVEPGAKTFDIQLK